MTKTVVGKGSVGVYRRMWMFSAHTLGGLRRMPITITAPPPVAVVLRSPWAIQMKHVLGR